MSKLLTVSEAAQRLTVSVASVRALIHNGKLAAQNMNASGNVIARYRISPADLQDYLDSTRVERPKIGETQQRSPQRRIRFCRALLGKAGKTLART
jgi:excisionase family DNA binding protein